MTNLEVEMTKIFSKNGKRCIFSLMLLMIKVFQSKWSIFFESDTSFIAQEGLKNYSNTDLRRLI